MFKPHLLIAALAMTTATIALDAAVAVKPVQAQISIGIGTGFGRRSSFGFGTSFGRRSSFGFGVSVGRPYRYYNPYRGNRVLIQRPYYPYYPGAVYPRVYQAPSVIVVPNKFVSPGYACGNTIYGSSIASPIPVDPYTGLACR